MSFQIREGADSLIAFLSQQGQRVVVSNTRLLDENTSERTVVEYTVKHTGRSETPRSVRFVGKFYNNGAGASCFRSMRALSVALGQGVEERALAAPEALHYDAVLGLLVLQRAQGIAYPELIGRKEFPDALYLAGRALAQLHGLKFPLGEAKSLDDHVNELIRPHPEQLARHYPEYQALIQRTLDRLRNQQETWADNVESVPIHRDFQLRQLFYAPPRAWLLDWDTVANGDPAFDVAYFVVYLRTHLHEHAEQAVATFLDGYAKDGAANVFERLGPYETFNYLRRACRRFRIKDRGWQEQMHGMLRQIETQ